MSGCPFNYGSIYLNACLWFFVISVETVTTKSELAAATSLCSATASDQLPPLLVPQHSTSSTALVVSNDAEEVVLAGLVDQLLPVSSKWSRNDLWMDASVKDIYP